MHDSAAGGHIVALGGGGFMMEPENPLLDRFVLSLDGRPLAVTAPHGGRIEWL